MMDKTTIEIETGMIEFLIQCVNSVQFAGKQNALRVIEADATLRLALQRNRLDSQPEIAKES
jgi:hypothetical protein